MSQAEAATTDAQVTKVQWSTPLTWVQSIPADFDDLSSFRHMRALAQGKLDDHERIGKTMTPALRKAEWDPVFAEDNANYQEAIRLIDERLVALGHDPKKIAEQMRTSPLYRAAQSQNSEKA